MLLKKNENRNDNKIVRNTRFNRECKNAEKEVTGLLVVGRRKEDRKTIMSKIY